MAEMPVSLYIGSMAPIPPVRPPAASDESYIGLRLDNRYVLERVIGRGGSAITFAATDRRDGVKVAVKLLRSDASTSSTATFRLMQEAKVTAGLRHPHIVALKDWGIHAGAYAFLVMELLSGHTLHDEVRQRGPLEQTEVFALLMPMLGAVAYAHDAKVLHRDLKPENIFLARGHAGCICPKLLDFGIAKHAEALTLTHSGSVVGTPAFMSPEQAQGNPLSPASDVWSIGMVFFFSLTGRLPFSSTNITQVLLEIVRGRPPSMERFGAVDGGVRAVIERAIRRGRRYHDVRSFARQLQLAALQAGLRVPEDPDPVGLPAWREWLQQGKELNRTSGDTMTMPPVVLPDSTRTSKAPAASSFAGLALGHRELRAQRPSLPATRLSEAPRAPKLEELGELTLDASTRPLVVVSWPIAVTDATLDSYFALLDAFVMDWRRSFGLLHKALLPASPPTLLASHRARIAAYSAAMRPRDEGFLKGIAYVVSSPLVRGITTAIHWVAPGYYPVASFESEATAYHWLSEKLGSLVPPG